MEHHEPWEMGRNGKDEVNGGLWKVLMIDYRLVSECPSCLNTTFVLLINVRMQGKDYNNYGDMQLWHN
jgi:hypothetical protein